MTERPVGVTDLASGAGVAQYRTRERTVGGQAVVEQYLLPISERVPSYKGLYATFRITGVQTADRPLASLFNTAGTGVLVAVRALTIVLDIAGASSIVRSAAVSRLTTAPTTGTLHTPVALDSALTHASGVEFRGAASADDTANAITATPTTRGWRMMPGRMASHIGQSWARQDALASALPGLRLAEPDDPLILREGQGILISAQEGFSTASGCVVQASVEEYSLP